MICFRPALELVRPSVPSITAPALTNKRQLLRSTAITGGVLAAMLVYAPIDAAAQALRSEWVGGISGDANDVANYRFPGQPDPSGFNSLPLRALNVRYVMLTATDSLWPSGTGRFSFEPTYTIAADSDFEANTLKISVGSYTRSTGAGGLTGFGLTLREGGLGNVTSFNPIPGAPLRTARVGSSIEIGEPGERIAHAFKARLIIEANVGLISQSFDPNNAVRGDMRNHVDGFVRNSGYIIVRNIENKGIFINEETGTIGYGLAYNNPYQTPIGTLSNINREFQETPVNPSTGTLPILDGANRGIRYFENRGLINTSVTNTGYFTNKGRWELDNTLSPAGYVQKGGFITGNVVNGESELSGYFENFGGSITGNVTNHRGIFLNGDSDQFGGSIGGNVTIGVGPVLFQGTELAPRGPAGDAIFRNRYASTIGGNLTQLSGTVENNGVIRGNVVVDGGTFLNNQNTGVSGANAKIEGNVTVHGGIFTNAGGFTANSGFDNNRRAAIIVGNVTVGAGGIFNNQDGGSGSFARDQASIRGNVISAGTFSNGGYIGGTVTINGGTFTNEVPTIGSIDPSSQNGSQVSGATTLNSGGLVNHGWMAAVTVADGAAGALNTFTNNRSAGNIGIGRFSTFTNSVGAFGGQLISLGSATNSGELSEVFIGTFGETTADFKNLAGATTKYLEVRSGSASNSGTIRFLAQNQTNSVAVAANASFTNESAGLLQGDLATAGTSTNRGTIAGAINVTGGTTTQLGGQFRDGSVSAGATLQFGDGGTAGAISSSLRGESTFNNVTTPYVSAFSNAGTLIFNRSDAVTVKGEITGSGAIRKLGAGALSLNGAYNYGAQNLAVEAGTLEIGPLASYSRATSLTVSNGSRFSFDTSATPNAALTLTGYGTIIKKGTGALTLAGGSTLTAIDVQGGDLLLASGATMGLSRGGSAEAELSSLNVASGARVDLGATKIVINGNNDGVLSGSGTLAGTGSVNLLNATAKTFGGDISGLRSFTKSGAGTLTLTGNNSFIGGLDIRGGTVELGEGGRLASGVDTGVSTLRGTLSFVQTTDSTFAFDISGNGGIVKRGTNVLTLTGNNTYSGDTSVEAGTLVIGSANALSPNTRVNVATGAVFNPGSFAANVSSLEGNGNINGGTGTVIVDTAMAYTFNGSIEGDRDLVKLGVGSQVINGNITIGGQATAGGGTLYLTGNNTFGKGVLVTGGGKVVLGSNNAAGGSAGKITTTGSIIEYVAGVGTNLGINNAAEIIINSNTTQLEVAMGQPVSTQSGVISELRDVATPTVGRPLEKIGGGTLILTAANTYTGMTTISGGALSVSSNANLGGTAGGLTLNGGTLITTANISDFQRAVTLTVNNGTFSPAASTQLNAKGVVSGTGRLTMAGAGTLVMEANNTYSGGTSINSGTVQVSSDANLGSAAGGLTLGSAILATTSSFTSARNVVLSAGTVGTFSTAAATTLTLTGVISDTGGLTKTGSGTLMLDGNNSHTYTGATTVNAGKLVVNGSIVASSGLTIANGASFGGNATIRHLTLQSGATLSPGNSIGTTNVTGNLVLNGGSTTAIEIQGAAMDRVVVGGTATLGGTLQLVGLGGRYSFGQAYNFLTSTGATTGTFSTLDTRFGVGVASAVSYSGTGAAVTLSAVPLSPLTNSQTAGAVASAMDRAVANGANASAFSEIYSQPTSAALSQAINQLSGVSHTGASALGNQASNTLISAMFNPTAAGRSAPTGSLVRSFAPQQEWSSGQRAINDALGRSSDPVAIYTPAQNYNIWASLTGVTSRASGDAASGLPRVSSSFGGLAAGADIRIAPETTIGAVISGATGSSSSAGGLGSVKTDMFQLGLYGSTKLGALSLAAASTWTTGEVEGSRAIPALGLASVKSNYNMQGFSGRFEATFAIANLAGITTSPYAAFQVSSIRTSSFVERNGATGAPVGLQVSAKTNTTARTELGLKLETAGQIGAMPATVFVRAGWGHYTSREANVTAQIVGLPGSQFTVTGIRPDQNVALIAAGAEVRLTPAVSIGGSLDAELGAHSSALKGSANFKYAF